MRQWLQASYPALLSLLLLSGCTTPPPFEGEGFRLAPRVAESFRSGSRSVPLEVMYAETTGPRPAVVMLHGASGIGNGYMLYPHAGAIAERGIHVFVVDYYGGMGSVGDRSSPAHFAQRERIIADAVEHVRSRPEVDAEKVGVFGLSLGGFHALSLATQDSRLAAVVDMMGAMPQSVAADEVLRMPPTLILHGSADRVVTPRRMAALASMLDRVGAPYEVKLYMGEGHTLSSQAHADSVLRTANFFDRHLNGVLIAALPRSRR